MLQLAQRMSVIQPSATVAVANRVQELKQAGQDIISLSIGVPGFHPPQHVYAAAHAAVDGDTGEYYPGRGTAALVQAFQNRLRADGLGDYAVSELCAALGGKNALFNLMQILVNPGDKVAFPSPYWTSYPDIAKLAGGVPVPIICPVEQDYKLTPSQLRDTLAQGVKVFIFNTPSNPTGMLYTRTEMAALADVLAEFPETWILSDDIYDKITYEQQPFVHLLHVAPALRERTIIMQSISKSYGMPGWRVGMVAGPTMVVQPLLTFVGQALMNVPGVSMAAAAAAFAGDHTFLEPIKAELQRKRDHVLAVLAEIPGVVCPKPQGAFYVFPDVSQLYTAAVPDDIAFCTKLLEAEGVALIPGSGFGEPQAVRISYATDFALLERGMAKFQAFCMRIVQAA